MPKPAIWGYYDTRDHARLARNRFKDQHGAYHRVRYMPSERYPEFPWAVVVYQWEHEADAINADGEVSDAVRA